MLVGSMLAPALPVFSQQHEKAPGTSTKRHSHHRIAMSSSHLSTGSGPHRKLLQKPMISSSSIPYSLAKALLQNAILLSESTTLVERNIWVRVYAILTYCPAVAWVRQRLHHLGWKCERVASALLGIQLHFFAGFNARIMELRVHL